ncbi:MAG: inorganic phosphate transporter [Bacteroidales bacterium]
MDIYLIIVIVLIVLALSDLVVGVTNDAVNFLNSAIGSKIAPLRVIMIVASLGVLIGATFSSGLMEVARKGIFHPDQFAFSDIMIIFLAVMITDIILLDLFNTFAMPTSTTVSIVFELLGAAVAVSVIMIFSSPTETLLDLNKYINSDKALAIILGILLSVIIAFVVGAVVQYFSRLLFTFRYAKNLKYFGSLWGGLAITAITFFMLIKGAKGASFITEEMSDWIISHTHEIIIYGLIGWTILLQVLNWAFKVSIPKVIVLIGTFALAMAFAGNDLVNFIGVPLAGLKSYQIYAGTEGADASRFLMGELIKPVHTPTYLLLIAGIIMIITLWLSKKARSVVETEVSLARQGRGSERFGSSVISRSIVRGSMGFSRTFSSIIPQSVRQKIDKRFEIPKVDRKQLGKEAASFDVIRASVNLVVASILIAIGTSYKLPLSTTYVTFMVAMGTSLSDRAWGRDSAVYRIQGVFSVIGGWFLTALIAFTVAFIIANIIYWGGIIAMFAILLVAVYFIYRTHILHRSLESEKKEEEREHEIVEEITSASQMFERCQSHTIKTLNKVPGFFEQLIKGLGEENRQLLKELRKDVKKYNKKTKKIKDNVDETVIRLQADLIDTGHYYVQSVDYLREIAHCFNFMANPAFEHIDNNHEGLDEVQVRELNLVRDGIANLYHDIISKIQTKNYNDLDQIIAKQQELLELIAEIRKNQIKRIKERELHTRSSLLFLDILAETKNLLLYSINLLKSQRDFIVEIAK